MPIPWALAGPLSERILFVGTQGGLPKIYIVRPDSKDLTRLTHTQGLEREPCASLPARCVAFRGNQDGNNEIYRCNLEGRETTRLTFSPGNDRQPSFSPDGKEIVFASERWGEEELAIMPTAGGDRESIRRLTRDTAISCNPAWSPTGEWIAYSSYRQGQSDIYLISPDGSQQRRLTRDWQPDCSPAWAPDGKKLVYQTQRGPRNLACLAVYDLASDTSRVLEGITELAQYPSWSPDGKAIMYVATGTRHVPRATQLQVYDLETKEIRALELPLLPGTPALGTLEVDWTPFPLPW